MPSQPMAASRLRETEQTLALVKGTATSTQELSAGRRGRELPDLAERLRVLGPAAAADVSPAHCLRSGSIS